MIDQSNKINISKIGIFIAYFLIYIVWGSTYYFIGVALKGLPPFLLGGLRFSFAGLILLVWCYAKGELIFNKNLIKKSAISGIVLLFIDMTLVMLAQQYLSSSLVAIIASSTAIWILVLDVPQWKYNFRNPIIITGIFIGFLGVLMLYIEQLDTDRGNEHREYGVLLLLVGCISWALGTLYTKYNRFEDDRVNTFAGTAWQMIFAGGMFWICSFINQDLVETDIKKVSYSAWYSLIYLIIFGSIFAYSAYIWLLKVRPATEVATHAYINPFVAVFFGSVFGKENVTWIQLIGLITIVLSVMLVNKRNN